MSNMETSLDEFMNDSDLSINESEYIESDFESDSEERSYSGEESSDSSECSCNCKAPTIKINSGLEVNIGNKNKVIYVCPGKIQYFTAEVLRCCDDDIIEIQYCGCNTKCICGETFILGRLGFYKIVNSGIIFTPKHNLSKFPDKIHLTDILHFKAKSKCGTDIDFVVVFTFSKCTPCKSCCKK